MSDIDHVLQGLGFTADSNGVLAAPKDSRTRLVPIGKYFEIRIGLDDGNAITVIVPRVAIKVTRDGSTSSPEIDPEALISGQKRRPW